MVKSYILKNFSALFFSIFFTLFIITSIIFFIQIASMTTVVKVTFLELIELYLFVLPNILFFTIPITFFASGVISLTKLSFDTELIVIFSLGFTPKRVAKIFYSLALLVTLTLLIISLGLMPLTKQLNKNFIYAKKANASLNIKATEFGQKFGDWLLFIEENIDDKFSNVVLYSNKGKFLESDSSTKNENFILAKEAKVENLNGRLSFSLLDGIGFFIEDESVNQIDFEKMAINDTSELGDIEYLDIPEYWLEALDDDKRAKYLSLYILISLFPILSIYMILAFGVLNPRYDKNHSYFYVIIATVIYYVLIYNGASKIPFSAILIIPPIWIFLSYLIYKRRVKRF